MSLNKFVCTGYLIKDWETKHTPTGTPVAQGCIAVNRFTKKADGSGYESDLFNLVAWDKKATFASQYTGKRSRVAISGRLQTRSWEAQDGTKRTAWEVVVEDIENLTPRDDSGTTEANAPAPSARPASRPAPQPTLDDDDDDDTDPFADE